jgi:hypothetical protein
MCDDMHNMKKDFDCKRDFDCAIAFKTVSLRMQKYLHETM